MKILSVTKAARDFSRVVDAVEKRQEEIVLVRNDRPVARIIPELSSQNALEVFGDLYRSIDDRTADALTSALAAARKSRRGRLSELRKP